MAALRYLPGKTLIMRKLLRAVNDLGLPDYANVVAS